MTRKPHVIEPGDSVTRAIMMLEEHRINQLPVIADGLLVGIITDRDLRDAWSLLPPGAPRLRDRESGLDSDRIPVEALMTREVVTVTRSDSLESAACLMRDRRIGGLPVVANGRLEGIITRSDILDAFLEREKTQPGR